MIQIIEILEALLDCPGERGFIQDARSSNKDQTIVDKLSKNPLNKWSKTCFSERKSFDYIRECLCYNDLLMVL